MKYLITILAINICLISFGQDVELDSSVYEVQKTKFRDSLELDDIMMITKSSQLGIEFRWAPTNVKTWYMAIEHGYTLERMVGKSREYETVAKIFPWSEDKWRPFVNDDNKYMAVAAMSIYGEKEDSGFVQAGNDAQNRHAFTLLAADLDKQAAEASGLYYAINDKTDESYGMYRIYTYDPETSESSDTAQIIGAYLGNQEILPPELSLIEQNDALELEWIGGGRLRYGEQLTAYHIERSSDGVNFSRILEEPFVNAETALQLDTEYTSYIDSVENGIKYYYRVVGIDAFADLTEPSNVVSGTAKNKTAPTVATGLEAKEVENQKINLKWDWEQNDELGKLTGFNIYRSPVEDRQYEKINEKPLSTSIRTYLDESPNTDRLNYYYVESVGEYGNVSASVYTLGHIVDLIPPQPPVGLTGEIDTNGMVLVTWVTPEDKDVMGYEVFFSNSEEYEYVKKATQIIENEFFIDSVTLKTLTKDIFYKVVAVDYNYNRSDLSHAIKVTRPDIIPPSPSVFTDYNVTKEGIGFTWAASTSDDVQSIILQRREVGGAWEVISDFDPTSKTYLDKNVVEGVSYEYNLITTDEGNNISVPEKTLILEALKSFYIQEVENLEVSKNDDLLELSWEYDNVDEHSFVVYKKASDGALLTYKVLEGENNITINYQKDKEYSFAVKARGKDGRESKLSKMVTID